MHLRRKGLALFLSAWVLVLNPPVSPGSDRPVGLSPSRWRAGEYAKYMKEQAVERTTAGSGIGTNGAGTVSYNAFAARTGLEALKQGGNAIDAALTTALTA
jgi:gamma-glutamyltranspeptidase/glutathione hydrolase